MIKIRAGRGDCLWRGYLGKGEGQMDEPKKRTLETKKRVFWLWCLHCYRCYKSDEFKWCHWNETALCPYEKCNGSVLRHGWKWSRFRRTHPTYPVAPERDKIYPLYE
jgi:hypothetical protein